MLEFDWQKTAYVSYQDRAYLSYYGVFDIVARAYLARMQKASLPEFTNLLKDPRFVPLNPNLILFANRSALSADKQALLLSPTGVTGFYEERFGAIFTPKLIDTFQGRAGVDSVTAGILGVYTPEAFPILDIPIVERLPIRFQFLANLMVELTLQNDMSALSILAGTASPFSRVISLQDLSNALPAFKYRFPLERRMCGRHISLYSQVLKKQFVAEFQKKLSSVQYQQLLQIVTNLN